jgi:hypothetical protein
MEQNKQGNFGTFLFALVLSERFGHEIGYYHQV